MNNTPNEDGSVNVDTLNEVLQELNDSEYKGIVVVKSTIISTTHGPKRVTNLKLFTIREFPISQCVKDFIDPNTGHSRGNGKTATQLKKHTIGIVM